MQFLFILLIPIIAFVSYTIIQKFKKQKPLEKGLVDQTTVEPKPLLCYDCKSGKHCTISKDEIRLLTTCPYCNKHITHLNKE